jgi:hypothetical protein
MRSAVLVAGVIIGLAWAVAILHGRVGGNPFAHATPRTRLTSTLIDPDEITIREPSFGVVAYHVPLPADLIDGDSVELRFRAALDGAKVDAEGDGPRSHAKLLNKRIGGDTVSVPLGPGRIDAVDLRVRHHFRTAPILRSAVVFVPATTTAADPPPAASPRSTR